MKGKKRHEFIWRLGHFLLRRYLVKKFNFEYDNINVEHSPYIVISNHLTNWDPLLIGLSFKKFMYFVTSDHVLRMGLVSKLLEFAMAPIARVKTAQETQTVISIFRRLKEKCNICLFAEGTTSFDGVTGEVPVSISKLIKRSGVALVTYKFTGSYLTFPRWARFVHKGKMEGRLVQIYSPEKIASMTEEEIYNAIKKDIYVNAYQEHEHHYVAYKGKNRAEYLETVLYCCPKCKQFGTLKSKGDLLSCSCGFKARYNEYAYFEMSNEPSLKTITDWIKWERDEVCALIAKDSSANNPLTEDEDQQLYEIARASHSTLIAKGKLCLYKDRLSIIAENGQAIDFPINEIIDVGIITMQTIVFSSKHKAFEIHSKHIRSALKYMDMINTIKSYKKE